jgi:hypothetical protein
LIAYKLFSQKKDGSIGPLFINKKLRLKTNEWYQAEEHKTKGFAFRPGFHVCSAKFAPHLSEKGRVWRRVEIEGYTEIKRPDSQGGMWYLASRMKVLDGN